MNSHPKLKTLQAEVNSSPADMKILKNTKKPRKPRPSSIDIDLANGYKERQSLPTIHQGSELESQTPGEQPSPKSGSGYVDIMIHVSLFKDQQKVRLHGGKTEVIRDNFIGNRRDSVTGRYVSKYGRTCFRCTEKGLRCTLGYRDTEDEHQCAACRRSRTDYCIRFQPPQGEAAYGRPFPGPAWRNPFFIAGRAEDSPVPRLSARELEEVVREFYEGDSKYVLGDCVPVADVKKFALPQWDGKDLPLEKAPVDWLPEDWRDVLPEWRHRSAEPRSDDDVRNARDERNRILHEVREDLKHRMYENQHRTRVADKMKLMVDGQIRRGPRVLKWIDRKIARHQERGKYEPREQHLEDTLGETW